MANQARCLLRIKEVSRLTGYSPSSIRAKERLGQFPQRVKLGARAIAYPSDHVQAWIEERIAPTDTKAPAAAEPATTHHTEVSPLTT